MLRGGWWTILAPSAGACGGECACSTCHVVLPKDFYDSLPKPSEEELDMLDLASGLTETSRLGCQVDVTAAFDGLVVAIPKDVLDLRSDAKPKSAV